MVLTLIPKNLFTLTSREENRTKINFSYSSFAEIFFPVRQASVLRLLLFDAYISDLFHDIDSLDFSSFADDNTPYSCLSDMICVLG